MGKQREKKEAEMMRFLWCYPLVTHQQDGEIKTGNQNVRANCARGLFSWQTTGRTRLRKFYIYNMHRILSGSQPLHWTRVTLYDRYAQQHVEC